MEITSLIINCILVGIEMIIVANSCFANDLGKTQLRVLTLIFIWGLMGANDNCPKNNQIENVREY